MGISRADALLAFLQGFSAALVSVAVRLVPIGQTAGLEALRDLAPVITAVATRAASASLEDLGAITIAADIAAMRHETQHSRVFRS
jgi:urease accessory protein